MAAKNSVLPIGLTTFDSSGLTGAYQAINAAGLPNPCFFIRIVNDSDADVTLSYDGTNNHDFLAAGQVLEINAQSNHRQSTGAANFAQGTRVSVTGSAGTGLIYLSGYYQP